MTPRHSLLVIALALGALVTPTTGQPSLIVDGPACCTVPQTFVLHGVAFQSDVVHVWAWPTTGPVFLGYAFTNEVNALRQLNTGGFQLLVRNAPIGTYPIVIYAHDPVTDTFPTESQNTYSVRACRKGIFDWPFMGPRGLPVFWMIEHCA